MLRKYFNRIEKIILAEKELEEEQRRIKEMREQRKLLLIARLEDL